MNTMPVATARRGHRPAFVAGAVVLAACAFVWLVTAATLVLLSPSRRPPRVHTWVIAEGTAGRIAAGENPLALPPTLVLLAGDSLRFVNHDGVDHTIGAWGVPAGSERLVRFARPLDGSLACSVHPAGLLGIDVRPRGLDLGLTVLPTILLGPGLAAILLGVRAVMRRLGDEEECNDVLMTPGTASGR